MCTSDKSKIVLRCPSVGCVVDVVKNDVRLRKYFSQIFSDCVPCSETVRTSLLGENCNFMRPYEFVHGVLDPARGHRLLSKLISSAHQYWNLHVIHNTVLDQGTILSDREYKIKIPKEKVHFFEKEILEH